MSRFTMGTYRPKFNEKTDKKRRKQLGALLRRARREAGLSQAAVARTLGYKQQCNISEIEDAKRFLDPIELENFAQLYGKALSDFATWQENQPSTQQLRELAKQNHAEALDFQRRYYKKKDRASDVGPA